jgi:hypothetical protein
MVDKLKKYKLYIGGGVLAIVVIIILASSAGKKPLPPNPPTPPSPDDYNPYTITNEFNEESRITGFLTLN